MKKPYNKPFVKIRPKKGIAPNRKTVRAMERILTHHLNSPEIKKIIDTKIQNKMLNLWGNL